MCKIQGVPDLASCQYVCQCPDNPAAAQARVQGFPDRHASSRDMQLNVPLPLSNGPSFRAPSVVKKQALVPRLLDPADICARHDHALQKCTCIVSEYVAVVGHAISAAL
jgi:hypothetical protein